MSSQAPPTNIGTPVYNPIFFIDPASSSGITIPFLDANYLKFPTAQGSEDFTNGLFSTDTIDFNSSTGANRAITNLSTSSFTDILGNASYTASIEENSTAIGAYDGGLVITSSNSINLVGADVLLNGVPITTGGGDVFLAGNNTFTGTNTFTSTFSVDNTQTNIGQLSNGTGTNTAIGIGSLVAIGNTSDNSSFGYHSLLNLTTGQQNTSVGKSCLSAVTSGFGNVAVGWSSLSDCLTNNYNIGIGNLAGYSLTSGDNNTFVGYQAGGYQTSGNNNVAIGYLAGVSPIGSSPTISDTIAIGNQVYADNVGDMVLGVGGGNFSSTNFPYYALFTPNTSFQGISLQGTYNGSNNFTINASNSSVALNSTNIFLNATSAVSVSNILQSPNNPNINILGSGQGTFYVSSQLPYFAYNNGGITTSQQLATASVSNSFTLTITPIVNPATNNTTWTTSAIIPSATLSSNAFTFSYYTNIVNTNVTQPAEVTASGNFVAGTGTAILQPVNNQPTYLFNLINNGGALSVATSAAGPDIVFTIADGGYFYNNSVNLVFNCLKIY